MWPATAADSAVMPISAEPKATTISPQLPFMSGAGW